MKGDLTGFAILVLAAWLAAVGTATLGFLGVVLAIVGRRVRDRC